MSYAAEVRALNAAYVPLATADKQLNLSTHFTLDELTRSDTAAARGIPNTPDLIAQANLLRLCTVLLEPIRTLTGQRLRIDSGFRSEALNTAIPEGGAHHSQHEAGCAADPRPLDGMSLRMFFDVIRNSDLPYDQCILEESCVHVSVPLNTTDTPRRMALIRKGSAPHWTYETP